MVGRRLIRGQTAGFFFVSVLGVLLHFAYEWSGSGLVGAFSAVNESIWEHMKLLFFPAVLFTLLECWHGGCRSSNFLAVRAASILAGTALIPVLYYTYSGILGRSVDWVNIAIFFVAALALFGLDALLHRRGALCGAWKQVAALAVLWAIPFIRITRMRLRDAGISVKAYFWLLLPVIGWIVFAVLMCVKGKPQNPETAVEVL